MAVKIYEMEDLHIIFRTGQSVPTGRYEITRIGTRREITKYREAFCTNAGNFFPEEWSQIIKSCVKVICAEKLLNRITDYCRIHCAWLKTDKDLEEYALDILVGRVYRYWNDFDLDGIDENTTFVFQF